MEEIIGARPGKMLGVDLGGTNVRAVLASGGGKFLTQTSLPTEANLGPDKVIENILLVVGTVLENSDSSDVVGLGIGAPGPLNPRTGVVYSPPNLPGWDNVPLQSILEDKLGLPVFLGNDANLAALGEYRFGAGKDYRNLVYVTVSTGIGGGIIDDGRLLDGARGAAGEIGHMTIEASGPLCNCGNRGCLEVFASGTAIRRRAIERLQRGVLSRLSEWAGGNLENLTAELVALAARHGDVLALELLRETGTYLGVGITNVLHLFNPEIVLIGGGVSRCGDLIFKPLIEEVNRRAMPAYRKGVPIIPTGLGDDIGLYGAVALVLQNYEAAEKRKLELTRKMA